MIRAGAWREYTAPVIAELSRCKTILSSSTKILGGHLSLKECEGCDGIYYHCSHQNKRIPVCPCRSCILRITCSSWCDKFNEFYYGRHSQVWSKATGCNPGQS